MRPHAHNVFSGGWVGRCRLRFNKTRTGRARAQTPAAASAAGAGQGAEIAAMASAKERNYLDAPLTTQKPPPSASSRARAIMGRLTSLTGPSTTTRSNSSRTCAARTARRSALEGTCLTCPPRALIALATAAQCSHDTNVSRLASSRAAAGRWAPAAPPSASERGPCGRSTAAPRCAGPPSSCPAGAASPPACHTGAVKSLTSTCLGPSLQPPTCRPPAGRRLPRVEVGIDASGAD